MTYYPRPIEFGAHYSMTSAETGVTAAFNNPFDPNYVGMLAEVTGLDSPEVRENAEDLVESDGGVHGRFYYGRRPISMNGKIFGHTSASERTLRSDRIRQASQAMRSDGYLSWVPADRVDNVVVNPRFANDLSTWTWSVAAGVTGESHTRVTGQNAPGVPATTTAAELTFTASANGQFVSAIYTPVTVPAISGSTAVTTYVGNVSDARYQYIHAQADVQVVSISAGAAPSFQLNARAYDNNNTLLGVVQITQPTIGQGGWVNVAGSLPISALPAGTARVSTSLTTFAKGAATYTVRMTNMMAGVRWNNKVPKYVDGSKDGGWWWGIPENSPSADYIPMGLNFRRQQPYRETGAWVKDFQIQIVSEDPYILSPFYRATTLPMGGTAYVNNQGNALYYPRVLISGGVNYGGHIDGNGGAFYTALNLTNSAGVLSLDVDTLTHESTEYIGIVEPGGSFINWQTTLLWPSIPPNGGLWSFTNGAGSTYTTGSAVVRERDAWV